MADIDVRPRRPGLRPWLMGILLLAALAALGVWLLDERGDDRALEGVSGTAATPQQPLVQAPARGP